MDKITEIKERAELMNLRKRVEDQRHEIIRLMGVIDSQRGIIAEQGKQIKELDAENDELLAKLVREKMPTAQLFINGRKEDPR